MTSVANEARLMRRAGIPEEEIEDFIESNRSLMEQAGFSRQEIGQEIGQPIFNDQKVRNMFETQFENNNIKRGSFDPDNLEQVTDFDDALQAGFGFSASSLLVDQPSSVLAENAPMSSRIASNVGTLAGDFPFMVAGAAAGAAIGAGVGGIGAIPGAMLGAGLAFALPELFRSTMMSAYENGEVQSFDDFMARSSGVFIDTTKAFTVGAATGGVGGLAGKLLKPKIGSPFAVEAIKTSAEVSTMVSVASALEGHVPEPAEFIDAAIVVGGLKGSMSLAAKGRQLYAKTGIRPRDVLEDAKQDVTIHQDIVARNKPIPETYRKHHEFAEPKEINFEGKSPKQMVDRLAEEMQLHEIKASEVNRVEETAAIIRDTLEARGISKTEAAEQVEGMMKAAQRKNEERIVRAAKDLELEPESLAVARKEMLDHMEIGGEAKRHVTFEDVNTAVFNDLNPIKQFSMQALGTKLAQVAKDPYKQARLTRGIFAKAAFHLERATFSHKTLKNNGKSLKEILAPVREGKMKPDGKIQVLDEFRAFAAAKDALDSSRRGVDTGFPLEAAKRIVAEDSGKYGKMQQELVEYQNRVMAQLRDSGILSEESYKIITDLNKNHVPIYKFLDSAENGLLRDVPTVRQPIKVRAGGAAEIKAIDPIESIVKNTFTATALADKNVVLRNFVELALSQKNSELFIKEVQPTIRGTTVTEGELGAFLKRHGKGEPPKDLLTVFRASKEPLKENEIQVFFEGKRRVFEVHPEIAKAFKALDGEMASLAVKMFAVPAKALRAGIVLSPDFIARNFFRDQPAAFALSKSGYMPGVSFVSGLLSIVKQDKAFENFLKSGGANATIVAMDRQYIKQEIFKLSGTTGLYRRAWNVVTSPLQMLGLVSEIAENSTRLGEFKLASKKAARAEALAKGEKFDPAEFSKAAIQEGGFQAREVTVDFLRKGSQMRAVSMLAAFFNPHLQGLNRTVRGIAEDPIGVSMKLGVSITLPTILLWMHNRDDPRYIRLPQWQKDFFWIIPTDYGIMRIPKSHELGMVFGTLPERLLDGFYRSNPDAFKGFDKTVASALIPNPIPTFSQPVVEQFANTSLFTSAPLIPSNLERVMPEYQYKEYTTETAKALGKMIGAFPGVTKEAINEKDLFTGGVARALTTPILMENYIRAWSGTMGQYALQLIDASLRKSGVVPDPVRPTPTLADIPFVRAFFIRYPSAGLEPIQRFYERYSERVITNTTLRQRMKEGDLEGQQRVLDFDNNAMVKLDSTKRALQTHSQMIRMINKDPLITPDEKRQLIDTLYFGMVQVAEDANKSIDDMEKRQREIEEETR